MLTALLLLACTKDAVQDSGSSPVDQDGDGYTSADDCDDLDASRAPGNEELCDEIDNDCDEVVDEGAGESWYADQDADGFGDDQDPGTPSCTPLSGAVDNALDCDDADATLSPNQFEVCDGIDNNCDGAVDEEGAIGGDTFYEDADGDGYGSPLETTEACDLPAGYSAVDTDCDDTDAAVHPGASETCNTDDDDCDGTVDEGAEPTVWFADDDGDTFGEPGSGVASCTQPADYVDDDSDCDDDDASIHPGATETCDEVDQDCDDATDEGATDGDTWYADTDSDGYGDAGNTTVSCDSPTGYVADSTDCDDTDRTISPAGTETCDSADNDCDGAVDEDDASDASTWYSDSDSDGYGDASSTTASCDQPTGYVADATDCDDTDGDTWPGATETCDGADNDCDGDVDDDATDATTWYADSDSDSYGDASSSQDACDQPSGYVADATDCDDDDSTSNPGATEVCDGNDNNCDGSTDEGFSGTPATWYADDDADGYGDASDTLDSCDASAPSGYSADDTDCDDTDGAIHPGATELCDGADNDCDGTTDEDDASDASTWYADTDGDGYGDASATTEACSVPSGYSSDATDCDDTDSAISPAGTELCDEVDNDCDGTTDEDDAADATDWFPDSDSDGFGDASAAATAQCEAPSGYVADDTDCDDGASDVNPDELEYCDTTDHDCDGDTEAGAADATTWYTDGDSDGYGDDSSTTEACTQPTGTSSVGGDCDDADSTTTTGSTFYADADGDGYGDSTSTATLCSVTSGYTADDTDCDDADANTYPTAAETCFDGVVNDCDGTEATALASCSLSGTIASSDISDMLYGEQSGDELGTRLTTGGDADGDGVTDILVSAPDAENGKTNSGLIYLHSGVSSGVDAANATWIFEGAANGDAAGTGLAGGLDVNGDGQDDLVLGAREYGSNVGAVYTYLGPITADGVLDSSLRTKGVSTGDCGADLASAGDMDGDGSDDVIVGCPNWSTKRGGFVFLMGPVTGISDMTTEPAYQASTTQSYAGTAVAGMGDTDGDGLDDAVASAPGSAAGSGGAWVFLGPQTGGTTMNITGGDGTYSGNTSGDACGDDVQGGDFDGDGYSDLILGCAQIDTVAMFLGPTTGTVNITSAYGTLTATSGADFGASLSTMGDYDGDGADDLVVGAPKADTSGSGAVYLFIGATSGGTAGTSAATAEVTGGSNAALGADVFGGVDFDGDSYSDLLIGATNEDSPIGQGVAGRAYLLSGAAY